MEKKNAGFTLVELLISVSILAVLGIAVAGFVTVCVNQYRMTSADADVQMEAQVTESQLQNIVLAASRGIWKEADAADGRYEVAFYSYDDTKGKAEKVVICYLGEEDELVYSRYMLDKEELESGQWKVQGDCEEVLFGQYVTGFSITLLDADGAEMVADKAGGQIGEVRVALEWEQNGRPLQTEFVIAPRNPVRYSGDVTQLYEGEM